MLHRVPPTRIALAQVNTTVGDFAGNAAKIREATGIARGAGATLVVFPELALSGYPPRDLLDMPEFLARAARTLAELAAPSEWSRGIALVIGFPEADHDAPPPGVYNAAALVEDGEVRAVGRKSLLPTYDVFDEARYFLPAERATSARSPAVGLRLVLSICEDIWNDKRFWQKPRYQRDPIGELSTGGGAAADPHRGRERGGRKRRARRRRRLDAGRSGRPDPGARAALRGGGGGRRRGRRLARGAALRRRAGPPAGERRRRRCRRGLPRARPRPAGLRPQVRLPQRRHRPLGRHRQRAHRLPGRRRARARARVRRGHALALLLPALARRRRGAGPEPGAPLRGDPDRADARRLPGPAGGRARPPALRPGGAERPGAHPRPAAHGP